MAEEAREERFGEDGLGPAIDEERLQQMRREQQLAIRRLVKRGIMLVPFPREVDLQRWVPAIHDLLRSRPCEQVNTLHRTSVEVSKVGFPVGAVVEAFGDVLKRRFGVEWSELTVHTAFAIRYAPGSNMKLQLHRDDSDVTLNLCIHSSEDHQGNEVMFEGSESLVGQPNPMTHERTPVAIPQLWAAVHWGRHPHETAPLVAGERTNIIIWLKKQA
eukprot:Hpha_TRINITY_DN3302_c1_g1::TRINITY_DN3302_c1_g1_i1::g.172473::m.172473